ncbi:hypothetical protein MICRO8M_20007 [Microbacterium sp. 8M]|nr:hypothetical protein MICRO8M_20007 [Microbacterium sp. 8M]
MTQGNVFRIRLTTPDPVRRMVAHAEITVPDCGNLLETGEEILSIGSVRKHDTPDASMA